MADTQKSSQIISENLDLFSRESDDLENHETNDETNNRSKFAGPIKRSRGYLVGLAFMAGLLLGWMVIGWWLWPVQWANSEPWDLGSKHQRTFVRLVAEDYWQTSDISRAREALAGWDEEALAELLAKMENQASSLEEQQHLAALAEALEMPDVGGSLVDFLLSQKAILLSSILSASPLVAAMAFAAYSLVRNRTQQAEALLAVEEQLELEELLAQEREEQGEQQDQEGEQRAGEEEDEDDEEDDDDEEDEEDEDDEEEIEYEEDDEEEIEPWAQDLVFDLFEEDDTEIAQIAAICKKLPDIDASDLLKDSKQTANDLYRGNALRQG
jgi:hypothetical protein